MKRWCVLGAGTLLAMAVGCDDGGGGGGGSLPSSVSSSEVIADLSQEQAEDLCVHYSKQGEAIAEDLSTTICSAQGLGLSMVTGQSCEEIRDACLEMESDVVTDEEIEADCEGSEIPDCPDVTVGEYDKCFKAQLRAGQDALGNITCNSSLSDLEAMSENEGDIENPPECEAIEEKCPQLGSDSADVEISGDEF